MGHDETFSQVTEVFLQESKNNLKIKESSLSPFLKKQFHYRIFFASKQLFARFKRSGYERQIQVSLHMLNETTQLINRLFEAQDLCLDTYRRIFFSYHPAYRRYCVWKGISTQKVYQKISKNQSGKELSTVQLREKRIKKY